MEYALKLEHVSKDYGDFKLQDINLTLPAGYIMGFIGENGAGKSTTIKLMLDLIRRDAGEILLLDQDNRAAGKLLRQEIGVVMDEANFPDQFQVADVDRVLRNIYPNWQREEFAKLVDRFSLPSKRPVNCKSVTASSIVARLNWLP